MKRRWGGLLIGTLAATVMLAGCTTTRGKLLEQLGVISAVGFDLAGDHAGYLGSVVLPNFADTGQEKIEVLSVTGRTSKELRFNMSRMSERELVSGQIRVVLFGEELARSGVLPLTDTLSRDPEIGSQIMLAVVEGNVRNYFEKRYPDKPTIDLYLYRMLRKEMEERTLPLSNLHVFIRDVHDEGKDPVLPYLRLGREDVQVDGVAVFRDDMMIGHLNAKETLNLASLYDGSSTGELDVTLKERTQHGENAHAVLKFLKTARHWEVGQVDDRPKFTVRLTIDVAVTEYSGDANLEEKREIKRLEQEISKELQQELRSLIKKLQKEYKTDQLGLGEMYRAKGYLKEFDHEDGWSKLYEKADIDVLVRVRILQTGMMR
jgi:spore germination protein